MPNYSSAKDKRGSKRKPMDGKRRRRKRLVIQVTFYETPAGFDFRPLSLSSSKKQFGELPRKSIHFDDYAPSLANGIFSNNPERVVDIIPSCKLPSSNAIIQHV